MSNKQGPAHVVVDGSNLATEGRSMPSLAQLSDAVAGFMEEHPDAAITVVVDATFGHRIDKKEVKEFEAGISNNELVAPPAGAVGRGDAFVLGIADKAGASVLSNDSFQEFHGDYTWLFDEGRLIGGKPVPHVGWVWVDRVPVRGPISRKATRGSGAAAKRSGRGGRGRSRDESTVRTGSKHASAPMPTPKGPPPGRGPATAPAGSGAAKPAPKGGDPVNDLMPFLDFVENHPVGTSINGTVDAYSSHGSYITIAESGVRGYIPLRLMAKPVPRSAKSMMKIGESVTAVVVSFAAGRRSIDCALPDMADDAIAEAARHEAADDAPAATSPRKVAAKKRSAKKTAAKKPTAKKTAAKKPAAKKPAAPTTKTTATKASVAKKSAAKKRAVKKAAATKTAAKKSAAPKTTTKKTAAKKSSAKKAATKKGAAKKPVAKKPAPKKSAAKKGPVKRTAQAAD